MDDLAKNDPYRLCISMAKDSIMFSLCMHTAQKNFMAVETCLCASLDLNP